MADLRVKGLVMICVVDGADAARFPDWFEAAYRLCGLTPKRDAPPDTTPSTADRSTADQSTVGRSDVGHRYGGIDPHRAVHHFCLEEGQVVGYQCVTPTLGPTLLGTLFPALCEGPLPRAANIYELALHYIPTSRRDGPRALSPTGAELVAGCIEWGLAHGINKIVVEMEPFWLLRAMQLRFAARPLGHQQAIGSRTLIATELTFDWRTLAAIREYRGDHARVTRFCGHLSETARRPAYAS